MSPFLLTVIIQYWNSINVKIYYLTMKGKIHIYLGTFLLFFKGLILFF